MTITEIISITSQDITITTRSIITILILLIRTLLMRAMVQGKTYTIKNMNITLITETIITIIQKRIMFLEATQQLAL